MVPLEGHDPSIPYGRVILSHVCMPIPTQRQYQIIQLSKIHSTNIDNYIKNLGLVNLNCKSRICTVDALLLLTLTFMTVKELSSF